MTILCTDWHDVRRRHEVFCRRLQCASKAREHSLRKKIAAVSQDLIGRWFLSKWQSFIHQLLHELESKGDGEREISEKFKVINSECSSPTLPCQTLHFNKWPSIPMCTSNVPINSSVSRSIWDGVGDWKCNVSSCLEKMLCPRGYGEETICTRMGQRPACPSRDIQLKVEAPNRVHCQEALLSYIFVVCKGDVNTIKPVCPR